MAENETSGAVGGIAALQVAYDDLRKKTADAKALLDAAIAAAAPRKVGDIVLKRGKPFSISRIGVQYGEPVYYAKRITKSGAIGTLELRLYGWDLKDQPVPSREGATHRDSVSTTAEASAP